MPNFLDAVRQALAQKQAQQRPEKNADAPGQPQARRPQAPSQGPRVRRGAARGG